MCIAREMIVVAIVYIGPLMLHKLLTGTCTLLSSVCVVCLSVCTYICSTASAVLYEGWFVCDDL